MLETSAISFKLECKNSIGLNVLSSTSSPTNIQVEILSKHTRTHAHAHLIKIPTDVKLMLEKEKKDEDNFLMNHTMQSAYFGIKLFYFSSKLYV